MKINTLIRYQYTADLYDFRNVSATDGVGVIKEFFFSKEVKLKLFFGEASGPVAYSAIPLDIGQRIMNIRTVNGEVLRPSPTSVNGFQYEVFAAEPILNGYGFRDSYRYETSQVR